MTHTREYTSKQLKFYEFRIVDSKVDVLLSTEAELRGSIFFSFIPR